MARYIDADKFKYSLELSIKSWSRDFNSKAPTITTTYKEVLHRLENMKTADVVEVKRGEWMLHPDGSGTCSCCNRTQKSVWDYDNAQNFCGHCGADMRGEEK